MDDHPHDHPADSPLRLRAPPDEVELIHGLRGRAESSMIRDLVSSRLSGKRA